MKQIVKKILLLFKPAIHKLARLFDIAIIEAYKPQGAGRIFFTDDITAVEHKIPKSTYFNTASGDIHIGKNVVFGEHVLLLTGKHLHSSDAKKMNKPLFAVPENGRDIVIESNVYIGSGAIIVGPCRVGENAVIGAGAVISKDVESYSFMVGNPAILKKKLTKSI